MVPDAVADLPDHVVAGGGQPISLGLDLVKEAPEVVGHAGQRHGVVPMILALIDVSSRTAAQCVARSSARILRVASLSPAT